MSGTTATRKLAALAFNRGKRGSTFLQIHEARQPIYDPAYALGEEYAAGRVPEPHTLVGCGCQLCRLNRIIDKVESGLSEADKSRCYGCLEMLDDGPALCDPCQAVIGAHDGLVDTLEKTRIALTFYRKWMADHSPEGNGSTDYPYGIDAENEARAALKGAAS